MTATRAVAPLAATLITFGSLVGGANAAILISNFTITTTTVSFDISGNLSGPVPAAATSALFFVNAVAADPGFVTPADFESPISHTWTGTQPLNVGFPLFTGHSAFDTGDYFGFFFAAPLADGEAINGSVSAIFAPGTFDPSAVETINVIWGSGGSSFSNGTLQDTLSVPEPSSMILLGLGSLAFTARRRRIS